MRMFQHVLSVPFSWITVFILIWFSWLVQLSQFTCLLRRVNLPWRRGPISIGYAVCCSLQIVLQSGGTESLFMHSLRHSKGTTYISMYKFSNSSSPKNGFKLNLVFLVHTHHVMKKSENGSTGLHVFLTCVLVGSVLSVPLSHVASPVPIECRLSGPQNWRENCVEEKNPCCCYQILYVDFEMKIAGLQYDAIIGHAPESA